MIVAPPKRRATEPFGTAAAALIAKNSSYREVAKKLDMSAAYLNRLINGERKVSIAQMEAIAEALGVPGSYFLEVRLARISERLADEHERREALWDEMRGLKRD